MECAPCLLLLLLLPLLGASVTEPEPCQVDDEDTRCVCNFSDPQPDWSSAFQCMPAVEVEMWGGGHSLEQFLGRIDPNADPRQHADLVKALRLRRLTVGAARIPAVILLGVLRMLGYSRLKELRFRDIEVTGPMPPPPQPQEATGPALSTLELHNVSWPTGGVWLSELQQWLKPGLEQLSITQAHTLAFSCEQVRPFSSLTTLDLSDNSGLDEGGLVAALCPHKFPALQQLLLRNAGMKTPQGVCAALAKAGVQPHHLDLSHNSLRIDISGCLWPSVLNSLNLSFTGLEQVPKGLPAKLSLLDLRCNKLDRAPQPDELPKVGTVLLDGNPFQVPGAAKQEDLTGSGVLPACAHLPLAMGVSGTLALLQGVSGFA